MASYCLLETVKLAEAVEYTDECPDMTKSSYGETPVL